MFYGNDPDGKGCGYSTRVHLAEVISILGLPPLDMLSRENGAMDFLLKIVRITLFPYMHIANERGLQKVPTGHWKHDIGVPQQIGLETSEEILESRNKEMF